MTSPDASAGPGVLAALPRRPLFAHPPAARFAQVFTVLSWVFCLGIVGFAAFYHGPEIWQDWTIRDQARAVRGGNLVDGKCSSKLFVHLCDATLTAPNPDGGPRLRHESHFAFASFDLGDFEARVVADPRQPEKLTTDLALDHFWDRVMTLAGVIALMGGVVIAGVVASVRRQRNIALWRTSPCIPVPLQLRTITKSRSGVTWAVASARGATASWMLPHRSKPCMVSGKGVILGLERQVDGAVMPLDAGLRWVLLTDAERAAVLAAANPGPGGA